MYDNHDYENTAPRAYPLYGDVPAQAYIPRPQIPAGPKEKKPKSSIGGGMVAVMLAMSLVGGAAGGGAVGWYRDSQPPASQPASAVGEVSPVAKEPAKSESSIAAAPAVISSGDVTSVVDKAADSVVEISINAKVRTFFGEQDASSAGSGVVLTDDGYIVTNHHVVEAGGDIVIRANDGSEYPAELIGADAKTDLAVIKVDATGLAPAVFADSDAVQVGQLSVAIGNPLGSLGGTVTNGIISARNREITIGGHTMTLMQTSAAVNPGNSGGGLFNAQGELIGVVNAKSSGLDVEGLGFAIPSNLVRKVTDDLIENGYVTGRPELGIKVLQVDDPRAADYYGTDGLGVFIMEVTRDNGLMAYDRIISINGVEIESGDQVSEAVMACKAGDVMSITVQRDGETLTLDVTVGEQIPEEIRQSLPVPSEL